MCWSGSLTPFCLCPPGGEVRRQKSRRLELRSHPVCTFSGESQRPSGPPGRSKSGLKLSVSSLQVFVCCCCAETHCCVSSTLFLLLLGESLNKTLREDRFEVKAVKSLELRELTLQLWSRKPVNQKMYRFPNKDERNHI